MGQTQAATAPASVQLEDLTWTELRQRMDAGATTVLLPVGGTEQNGPHMALGKHNFRVKLLATRIAERLGNAIVAPVLAYVPEGAIAPPTGHMRWPGTISISDTAFEATLEAAARSFRQHGFCHIVLLGDSGNYRANLARVATRLNNAWVGPTRSACRVHPLPEYQRAGAADFAQVLQAQGYGKAEIGSHAGLADTALMLAVDPSQVRSSALAQVADRDGVAGDPRRATAELGRPGLAHIVDSAVAAIRAATTPKN
ncbi:MAG: creatininase family protein [Chitinophagaceae bacterium]|nr:creatininase family protein [Rubrivivax sp.]